MLCETCNAYSKHSVLARMMHIVPERRFCHSGWSCGISSETSGFVAAASIPAVGKASGTNWCLALIVSSALLMAYKFVLGCGPLYWLRTGASGVKSCGIRSAGISSASSRICATFSAGLNSSLLLVYSKMSSIETWDSGREETITVCNSTPCSEPAVENARLGSPATSEAFAAVHADGYLRSVVQQMMLEAVSSPAVHALGMPCVH